MGRCTIQFVYFIPSAIHKDSFKEKTSGTDTTQEQIPDEHLLGDKDISFSVSDTDTDSDKKGTVYRQTPNNGLSVLKLRLARNVPKICRFTGGAQ
jgi:hypothetical protein